MSGRNLQYSHFTSLEESEKSSIDLSNFSISSSKTFFFFFLGLNTMDLSSLKIWANTNLVKWSENGDLINLDYHQFAKFDPEINRCRGLLLDTNLQVVAQCLPRFNYSINRPFNSIVYLAEKLDGSMVQLYWYKNKWNWKTRGTITCDRLRQFLINQLPLKLDHLNRAYTYIFELCSPQNRVVLKYKTTKLYLLAAVHTDSSELSYQDLAEIARSVNCSRPNIILLDKGTDLLQLKTNILKSSMNQCGEGYILCFESESTQKRNLVNIQRSKIKTEEYLEEHYQKSGLFARTGLIDKLLFTVNSPNCWKIAQEYDLDSMIYGLLEWLNELTIETDFSLEQKAFATSISGLQPSIKSWLFAKKKEPDLTFFKLNQAQQKRLFELYLGV